MRLAFRILPAVYLAASVLGVVASGAAPAQASPAATTTPQAPGADELFRLQRWAEAAEAYRLILEIDPQDAGAWFKLGYALHSLEQYDEALACHEQAAVLPSRFQIAAIYNIACVRALRGEVERAMQELQRAVDAGFRDVDLLDSDADLNNLRTDPRFRRLRAELVSLDASTSALPCPPGNPRQFDFLVGRWLSHNWTRDSDGGWCEAGKTVFDTRSVLGGEAVVTFATGRMGERDVRGVLLRRYDADEDQWITISNWPEAERSTFAAMRGRFRHGRAEFYTRFYTGPQGEPAQTRATICDVSDERLRMDTAVTTDGGRSWQPRVIYELERVPDAAPVEAATLVADTSLTTGPEFRTFDFLVGDWSGERVAAACGTTVAVDVFVSPILGGAALAIETRVSDPAAPRAAADCYEILGYEPGGQRWVRYAVEVGQPGIQRQEGRPKRGGRGGRDELCLAGRPGPGSGGSGCRVRWLEREADRVVSVCERRELGDDAWATCWRQELRRVQ